MNGIGRGKQNLESIALTPGIYSSYIKLTLEPAKSPLIFTLHICKCIIVSIAPITLDCCIHRSILGA